MCAEVGVSKHTIYAWKASTADGCERGAGSEAVADENTKLKKLVVDLSLDKEM